MKAILVESPGGVEKLKLGDFPTPEPKPDDLLVRVRATALNRADILQRQGKYPPPPGASPLLGLEMAGEVEVVGSQCRGWKKGDRVMALLAGGGYAQYAAVPCGMAMRIPSNLSFEEAAAIPEAFLTAFQVLVWIGRLQEGDYALIHAGASGVGSAAVQLVKDAGGFAVVTAGSAEKLSFCHQLGAVAGFNYKEGPFASGVLEASKGHGADIIIDPVGASHWEQNLACLAVDGRWILIATMGGSKIAEVNLIPFFRKRGQLTASTLRSRPPEYKIRLTQDFAKQVLPRFARGRIRAVVDKVFHWSEVREAHRYLEENRNMGKVVLRVD